MIALHNNKLSTAAQREVFFMALYKKMFPIVARYIAKMGGSLDEAQDVFQDSLVIYYEKIVSIQAGTIVNEQAYLLGIAKKQWLRYCSDGSKTQLLDDTDIADVADEKLANGKLFHYLETAGKKCMELLKAYYYDHLTVGNVVTHFGYSSNHSATVAKYKCLEKVRENVQKKSLSYADFIE